MDILVKAFANVSGLGGALERDGRLKDVGQFRAFATGFSNRQAFFDIVDVGPGKERADFKIRGEYQRLCIPFSSLFLCSILPPGSAQPYCFELMSPSQKTSSFSWRVSSVYISWSRVDTMPVMPRSWGSLLETGRLPNV